MDPRRAATALPGPWTAQRCFWTYSTICVPRRSFRNRREAMNVMRLRRVLLAALLAAGVAQAQGYPAKTIRWIVPWTPGGGADGLSRMLSPQLSEALKPQIVIDNRG